MTATIELGRIAWQHVAVPIGLEHCGQRGNVNLPESALLETTIPCPASPTLSDTQTALELNGVTIADTFAEAFPITALRAIITAETLEWARIAAAEVTGNATSVIACDVEAAIEGNLMPEETPDGRPGVAVLFFAFSRDRLAGPVASRIGQCVLTCPTTACYDGLPDAEKEKRVSIGGQIRFFGDGYQIAKKLGDKRYWRIPVMDGEFVCQDRFGTVKGVAGGNLLICGETSATALAAAERAVAAMASVSGTALPFPGGIVRSGSKVGSRYKALKASTNDPYCPTLRGVTETQLQESMRAVYEIVIDGLSFEAVAEAMRVGLHAACAGEGVVMITAGNYGGKLGPHHFFLRDLI